MGCFRKGDTRRLGTVIECPYCHAPLSEESPACTQCQLDLERAKQVLGPAPRLSHLGVTDFAGCLREPERKKLVRAVRQFQERFPQSRLAVVFHTFSTEFPLGTQLFWLFNSSGLASDACKEGNNRDILIGVDPNCDVAGLTIGYGLEPFLAQAALDHVTQLAVPKLAGGEHAEGVLDIIGGLARLMEGVCRELSEMLGLDPDFATREEKPEEY